MFGPNQKQTNTPTQASAAAKGNVKPTGTTYDLCRPMKQENGKEKLARIGIVFIREDGTGGVVYLNDGGTKYKLPVFAKRPRNETPKQAAAQPEAAVAA